MVTHSNLLQSSPATNSDFIYHRGSICTQWETDFRIVLPLNLAWPGVACEPTGTPDCVRYRSFNHGKRVGERCIFLLSS